MAGYSTTRTSKATPHELQHSFWQEGGGRTWARSRVAQRATRQKHAFSRRLRSRANNDPSRAASTRCCHDAAAAVIARGSENRTSPKPMAPRATSHRPAKSSHTPTPPTTPRTSGSKDISTSDWAATKIMITTAVSRLTRRGTTPVTASTHANHTPSAANPTQGNQTGHRTPVSPPPKISPQMPQTADREASRIQQQPRTTPARLPRFLQPTSAQPHKLWIARRHHTKGGAAGAPGDHSVELNLRACA